MAKAPITELKDRHAGQDIWVIAAGPSAGYVDPAFFENKVTIGVNRVWVRFRTDYLVLKEMAHLQAAIDTGSTVIASRYNCGSRQYVESQAAGDWYYFDHRDNQLQVVDLDVVGSEDQLVVSFSTITSAMHAAAYLGAANIMLVGHDCGLIDGEANLPGYGRPIIDQPGWYEHWLSLIEPQSLAVRDRLEAVYGCRVYSLNPWINLGLEGHRYVKS